MKVFSVALCNFSKFTLKCLSGELVSLLQLILAAIFQWALLLPPSIQTSFSFCYHFCSLCCSLTQRSEVSNLSRKFHLCLNLIKYSLFFKKPGVSPFASLEWYCWSLLFYYFVNHFLRLWYIFIFLLFYLGIGAFMGRWRLLDLRKLDKWLEYISYK